MTTVKDIFDALCEIAPLALQTDFDNAGFLVGHADAEVRRVVLALDITGAVIDEAAALDAQLVVAHHPIIFHPLKSVTAEGEGALVLRLIENRLAAICMHTNLDIAEGGVNDVLIRLLGAEPEEGIDAQNCGRVGTLAEPLPLAAFLTVCKERLHCNTIRYYDAGRPVRRLGVMGGAGGGDLASAIAHGCDTYVTADIKYSVFLEAAEKGVNLIDADHFCTENPVIPVICERLQAAFPDVDFVLSSYREQLIRHA